MHRGARTVNGLSPFGITWRSHCTELISGLVVLTALDLRQCQLLSASVGFRPFYCKNQLGAVVYYIKRLLSFKDNKQFMFKGDRTKEELINFAIRLSGPPVQRVTRSESMDHLKATNELFFVYVGDYLGELWVREENLKW